MNGDTTGGEILVAVWPKHGLRSDLRVPNLKDFPGGACPQTPASLYTIAYVYPSSQWPYQNYIAPAGDIQFGLPAMHLRAGRGVASQKFSGAICAPVAEPPFLNF